jgi:hypothetical protein
MTVIMGSYINKVQSTQQINHISNKYRTDSNYINGRFKVLQDIHFDSIMDATIFVRGRDRECDPYDVWKGANGVTLKRYLKEINREGCIRYDAPKMETERELTDTNTPTEVQSTVQEPSTQERVLETETTTITPTTTPTVPQNKIPFRILEQQFRVDSYVDMYYKVLEVMLMKYPYRVAVLGSVLKLNISGISLFSYNENDVRFSDIPIKRRLSNNLWVGIVDNKDTILGNIYRILDACNCPKEQFKIL